MENREQIYQQKKKKGHGDCCHFSRFVLNIIIYSKNKTNLCKILCFFQHVGVLSIAIQGDEKDQLVVTGEGFDSVKLTMVLRKEVGFASVISFGPDKKWGSWELESTCTRTRCRIKNVYHIAESFENLKIEGNEWVVLFVIWCALYCYV